MKKIYLLSLLCLFTFSSAIAQKDFNVWHFGTNAGIDFNSGGPVAISGGVINSLEGCASICNSATGQLLMYTDGATIRNRNHAVMPNGTGLVGNNGTTQTALIVPKPGSATLFYVFTLPPSSSSSYSYSIVDMTLAGGFGDVVATSKNIAISTGNTEKQTAVRHSNGSDWWIITHVEGSNAFRAYLLTAAGLNTTPIVSNVGTVITIGGSVGYMVGNNAGNKICATNYNSGTLDVLDFNKTTGAVSNPITLTGFTQCYGVAFSQNDQVMYVTNQFQLFQFDLSSNITATIQASKVILATEVNWMRAMMPGIDGKIYVCREFLTVLGAINNPNVTGTGCNYVNNAVTLTTPNASQLGLPNNYPTGKCRILNNLSALICTGQSYATGGHTYTTTGIYMDSLVTSSGCDSIVTLNLTVNPPPAPPAHPQPLNICQFDVPTPLTATGTAIQWYATATGGTASTTAPTPPTNVPGTYNYYVSQTIGCEGPRGLYTVVVNAKPAPPTVQSPQYYCQYDNTILTAQGQNLKWYLAPTGGGGQPFIQPNTANTDSAYYYVTQTVNGCESDRARVRVYVNYKPNGIITTPRLWVCQGETDSFFYFGNALPDAIYNWTTPLPQTVVLAGNGTQGPLVVRFDTAGFINVKVQVNNRGCLSEVAVQKIEVRPNPSVVLSNQDDACVGEIVNIALSGISPLISDYKFNFGSGTVLYGAEPGGPFGVRYSTAGTKVIQVVATARQCPSRIFYDTIEVHPLPDASIIASSTSVCAGDSIQLQARNTDSNTHFIWTPDNFFSTGNIFRTWAVIKKTGQVKLTLTDKYGCMATDSLLINTKPCCSVFFPNAFTPNNDTKNDFFHPISEGHHEIVNFRVINRWGQVVYESKDELRGWDGTYNGKPQDMGSYYYYIRYKCNDGQDLEQKGEVMLMR